jgi:hypothetical protein
VRIVFGSVDGVGERARLLLLVFEQGRKCGGPALSNDLPLCRPDISPVGRNRTSVMRCCWSRLVAAVAVTVAVSPGQDAFARLPPGVRLVTARTVEGMAPYPGQARQQGMRGSQSIRAGPHPARRVSL